MTVLSELILKHIIMRTFEPALTIGLFSDPGYLKKKNKYICLANDRRYNHFIQGTS